MAVLKQNAVQRREASQQRTIAALKDGAWKLAAFHASTDMFDNPVLQIAVRTASMWAGCIAGLVGIVLGFGAAWFWRRRA